MSGELTAARNYEVLRQSHAQQKPRHGIRNLRKKLNLHRCMHFTMRLTWDEEEFFRLEATRRGLTCTGLLGIIMEKVVEDKLFAAILDD